MMLSTSWYSRWVAPTLIRLFFAWPLLLAGCAGLYSQHDVVDHPALEPALVGTWVCGGDDEQYLLNLNPPSSQGVYIIQLETVHSPPQNQGAMKLMPLSLPLPLPLAAQGEKKYWMQTAVQSKRGTVYALAVLVLSSPRSFALHHVLDRNAFTQAIHPNTAGEATPALLEYEQMPRPSADSGAELDANPDNSRLEALITSAPQRTRAWLAGVDEGLFAKQEQTDCRR